MTLPIVERLRNPAGFDELLAIGHEAADTIEELVEALKLARAAIVPQPAVVPLLGHIDTILTKIGGDQ